ncbi:hypothetical protein EZV73_14385 [Acidaminobacter sp. JC074]|uniref:ATP-binding protein n=1 Tax=Acidaminobacter sp. JC074 TaxID=2530199 RepID=UPI001F0D4681|nr:ATP-binding protein [Acidaminobacter sp. JC074]MCH4888779.1 hypothetical protein [Acidaminobacter sp. JC074]
MSLNKRIVLLILSTIAIVSIVISSVILISSQKRIQEETMALLDKTSENNALLFNRNMESVEEIAYNIRIAVESSFDADQIGNTDYLRDYELFLEDIIYKMLEEKLMVDSGYMYFDPSVDSNETHDVWLSDLSRSDTIERQEEVDFNFYSEQKDKRQWYHRPKETGLSGWTDPFSGTLDYIMDEIFVSFTTPVYVDDVFIGVAGSEFYLSNMIVYLDQAQLSDDAFGFVLNEELELVIDGGITDQDVLTDSKRMIRNGELGVQRYGHKLIKYVTLSNGWHMVFSMNASQTEKISSEVIALLVTTLIILGLVLITASLIMNNMLIRPIKALIKYVSDLSSGKYDQVPSHILLNSSEEIHRLTSDLQKLSLSLKTTYDDISHYKDSLEERVDYHTKELSQSQEILENALSANEEKNQTLTDLNKKLNETMNQMKDMQYRVIQSEKTGSLMSTILNLSKEFHKPLKAFSSNLLELKSLSEDIKDDMISFEAFKADFLSKSQNCLDALKDMIVLIDKFKMLDQEFSKSIKKQVDLGHYLTYLLGEIVSVKSTAHVLIDTDKLEYVMNELVLNAKLHSRGRVHIDLAVEDEIIITVTDDGIGMTDQVKNLALSPFYSSLPEREGLGLSISSNIVESMFSGKFIIESNLNQGTRIKLILPKDKLCVQ